METFGRYQLIAELGQGGMAQVFLAQLGRGPLGKLLAIKRLLPSYSGNRVVVERLAAEARLTVWLSHPNIVQVFDFGRVDDYYYIAMEYVDGCDLRDVMRPRNRPPAPLPVPVALEVGYRVLDALRHAHTCADAAGKPLGIIHRDVSPHNVLISRDGHPKLADFGVARATMFSTHHTHPRAIVGKLSYMAPEQVSGQGYDARIDLYAAGVMIYEMMTGRKAFPERSSALDVGRLLPPAPSSVRPGISPAIDALLLRAMAPRPEDRFPTASAMAEALLQELVAIGGPPDPTALRALVAEAVRDRQAPLERASTGSISIEEYDPGVDSLISEDVTDVKRHHKPTAVGPVDGKQEALARLDTLVKAPLPATDPAPLPPTEPWPVEPKTEEQRPPWPTPEQGPAAASRATPEGNQLLLWGLVGAGAVTVFTLGLLVGRCSSRPPAVVVSRALSAARSPGDVQPARDASADARLPFAAARAADAGAARIAKPTARPDQRAVEEPSADRPIVREEDERPRARLRPEPDKRKGAALGSKGISEAAWRRAVGLLKSAQNAYVVGDYGEAISLSHQALARVPESSTAWQIIVASHCAQGNRKEATTAYAHIEGTRRHLPRQVCARQGINLR